MRELVLVGAEEPNRGRFEGLSHMNNFYKVVLQKSIPAQNREPILYISNNKESVDEFVQELTCRERLYKHFL